MGAPVIASMAQTRAELLALHRTTPRDQMVEIVGAAFAADEDAFFGVPNWSWIAREQEWYDSLSLNVDDIPGGPPTIWSQVAADDRTILSNYGYAVYSDAQGSQYDRVAAELTRDPASRRGSMIVTRPSVHTDATWSGRDDFICTHAVDWLIRAGELHAAVHMRSSDAVLGVPTDLAWWRTVQTRLAADLNVAPGGVVWYASSLHVYPGSRHRLDKHLES